MARKLNPSAPAPAKNPLADLYIMKPPTKITVGGREITLGEYALWDGLTARAVGKPLTDDLEAMASNGDADDAVIESYLDLLAKHRDLTRELIILAVAEDDRDEAFLRGVKGPEADLLLMTWWNTCSNFFWRQVVGRKRDRVLMELRQSGTQTGPTSSTPSPTPVTGAAATSAGSTPSAN